MWQLLGYDSQENTHNINKMNNESDRLLTPKIAKYIVIGSGILVVIETYRIVSSLVFIGCLSGLGLYMNRKYNVVSTRDFEDTFNCIYKDITETADMIVKHIKKSE